MIACKIGVQNITDFVVKAGLKTSKGISRSFVIEKVKVLKVEIERIKKKEEK